MFLNRFCFCMTILVEKVKETTMITHRNVTSTLVYLFVFCFVFFFVKLNFLGVHSFLLQFTNIFLQASLSHENIEFYSNSPTNEEKVFYIYI